MTDILLDTGLKIFALLLSTLATLLAVKLNSFVNQKKVREELKSKQDIIKISVQFAQQVYALEDGTFKLEKAKEEAIRMLNKNGIPFDSNDLDTLIESSVKGFKDGWNDSQNNQGGK